jgi:RNA polymerase sigma-70 factor, ECF subfamily
MAIDNIDGGLAPARPISSRPAARTTAEPDSTWLSYQDVLQTHLGSVHRFYLVTLGSPVDAAPAVRRVLAAAGEAYPIDRPSPPAVPRWLLGIACRVFTEERSRRRARRVAMRSAAAEVDADVAASLAVAADLPERERLALGLRCGAGLGYPEIGGLLGITEEAARMACRWAAWCVRHRGATGEAGPTAPAAR